MKSKYFMAVQNDKVLDILIYGDITSWEWYENDVSSYTLAKIIDESDAEQIIVRINSYGGEVAEGLAIYNSLKNHKAKITTVCDGFACSAASVVFMAGDIRKMNYASLLMIHNAWSWASGNAKELRKYADDLEKISTAAANAYRAVMKITEDELTDLLDKESWILPEEAVSYGFATEIVSEENSERQQYSARKKVFGQLVSGKKGEEQKNVPQNLGGDEKLKQPDEVTGFQKLFDKFRKGE